MALGGCGCDSVRDRVGSDRRCGPDLDANRFGAGEREVEQHNEGRDARNFRRPVLLSVDADGERRSGIASPPYRPPSHRGWRGYSAVWRHDFACARHGIRRNPGRFHPGRSVAESRSRRCDSDSGGNAASISARSGPTRDVLRPEELSGSIARRLSARNRGPLCYHAGSAIIPPFTFEAFCSCLLTFSVAAAACRRQF